MSKEIEKEVAFELIKDLTNQFRNLDGQEVHNATFPLRSVISETTDEAKQRAAYENFLKTHEAAEDELENFAFEFVKDMIYKSLDRVATEYNNKNQ